MNSTAVNWLYLDVERKNSSDEHILIALVTQSYYAASDPWPLTFDPLAHFKEEIQGKNSHNRPDSSNTINSVGDGTAVEYYFASDARWDTISRFVVKMHGLIWLNSFRNCMNVTQKYEEKITS